MLKIIVTGAAGRMGRFLVSNIAADPELELAGATEHPASSLLGADAGEVAGVGKLGVTIVPTLEEAFANGADAIIDFSTGSVLDNAKLAASKGAAIVIGTTALTDEVKAGLHELADNGARIIQTYNYSVGVNLLFYLSGLAAKILSEDFDIEIVEAHHNQKKDAPSGTAARLAEILCEVRGLDQKTDVRHGREGIVGARTKKEIGMHAVRGGDIVGDHTVMFAAQGERVELTHKASSRETFAKGAIRAAKYLAGAPAGYYDMQDVLGLK